MAMGNDFKVGNKEFKLSKIDAFKQFHIVRRIVPILNDLLPAMGAISKSMKGMEGKSEDEKLEQFAKIGKPVMDGLSKLSDEDANYVLFGLLASVEVKQAEHGNYAFIVRNGTLMFPDLDLPTLLQAAGRAFAFNMSGFFSALPQAS